MIEPKVQDRPKIVLDLEEPEIKIGPRKLFSDLDFGLGQQAKICKELQTAPKGVLGPGDFKKLRIGPRITRWTKLGINVIKEAHLVIYFNLFYKGCKIRKTQDIRPNPNLIFCA